MTVHILILLLIPTVFLSESLHWKAHPVFPVTVSTSEPEQTVHTLTTFSGGGSPLEMAPLLLREPRLQSRKCQEQTLALTGTSPEDARCVCAMLTGQSLLCQQPRPADLEALSPIATGSGVGLPLSLSA